MRAYYEICRNSALLQFQCCGVNNYTDWHESLRFEENSKSVPDSCCFEDKCDVEGNLYEEVLAENSQNDFTKHLLSGLLLGLQRMAERTCAYHRRYGHFARILPGDRLFRSKETRATGSGRGHLYRRVGILANESDDSLAR